MLARDAMTRNVISTHPSTLLIDAARMMREHKIGCMPIITNDMVVGIITDSDFTSRVVAGGLNVQTTTVGLCMSIDVSVCTEDVSLTTATKMMHDAGIHHLPVLNSLKRIVGILTLSDIALYAQNAIMTEQEELLAVVSRLAARDSGRHQSSARN